MMNHISFYTIFLSFLIYTEIFTLPTDSVALEVNGITVTPHVQSPEMKYREAANFSLGARVQLFMHNETDDTVTMDSSTQIELDEQTPQDLLNGDAWSWYDFADAWGEEKVSLKPDTLTVWTWNGNYEEWGVSSDKELTLEHDDLKIEFDISINNPEVWISSVTFLGDENTPNPNQLIFHIANNSDSSLSLESCRLWLPESRQTYRVLHAQEMHTEFNAFPADGVIPRNDRGGAVVDTGELPLTYTALEVKLKNKNGDIETLWAHLRIKHEVFDISGGWVNSNIDGKNSLSFEPFLKTLKRMHINTAHMGEVGGYTDNPELYEKYPLKRFNKLENVEHYQSDEMLKEVHAVEFLGEPQYGGGTPVPPMEVWRELLPYQSTKLPTTVTHSEERIWRFYSGLSDYPHYDAYRITAPSADYWLAYERWDDQRIRWGAPLETIGVMTRSLRELNRPSPIAYWSQGAHDGWGRYGGRERTSPTPAELRAQAYHALAARITSLYWFNLSLKSILKFPDLIDPITKVGREIKLLEDFYLKGDAYHYQRVYQNDKPIWDLSTIASPEGALLFALDLDYQINAENKTFEFKEPRVDTVRFSLPAYLSNPETIIRVSADDVKEIDYTLTNEGVEITDTLSDANIYVATNNPNFKDELEQKRQALMKYEESFEFDPANNSNDLETLQLLLSSQ